MTSSNPPSAFSILNPSEYFKYMTPEDTSYQDTPKEDNRLYCRKDEKFYTLNKDWQCPAYYSDCGILNYPDYPKGICNPFVYYNRLYREFIMSDTIQYDEKYLKYFVTIELDGTCTYRTPYGCSEDPSTIPHLNISKEILDSPKVRHYKREPPKPIR